MILPKKLVSIPEYADVMPLHEWREAVRSSFITPDDGTGHWIYAGQMDAANNVWDYEIAPNGADAVAWFNK